MHDSLIIDARHQLRWHHRLFSDASTVMLWGSWLWLWRPVTGTLHWLSTVGTNTHPLLLKLLAGAASIESSVIMLAGTSGTLLLWRLLPSLKARPGPAHALQDYASHFQLPEETIAQGRTSSVCVVHHDEQGRIIRIDCRD